MASLKIRIKVTNKCKNNCWFCLSDDKTGNDISNEIVDTFLDRMYNIYKEGNFKRLKIDLTGGDPFYSNTIIDVTNKIIEKFHDVHSKVIIGNVCVTSKIEIVNKFIDLGGAICLSLNEHNLGDIINLYKKMNRKSVFLFNVLLTNFNIDRMDEIINAVLTYKLPFRLNYVYDPNPTNENLNRMIECVDYVYPKLKKEGFVYNIFNYPFGCIHFLKSGAENYCGYGKDSYFIDTYGTIRRCPMEENLSNILNSKDVRLDIQKEIIVNEKCSKCDVFSLCKGGCIYTNKFNKYCDLQYKICKHIMNMDFRKVGLYCVGEKK